MTVTTEPCTWTWPEVATATVVTAPLQAREDFLNHQPAEVVVQQVPVRVFDFYPEANK